MRLNVKAVSFACAIICGVGLFLLTWWMILAGRAAGEPNIISKFYLGYSISPVGSFVGLVWAFVDGLVSGAIFAWLYNLLLPKVASATEPR